MKYIFTLLVIFLIIQYENKDFLIVKDQVTKELFEESIDFVTIPIMEGKRDFFLVLKIINYSEVDSSFEYKLSQKFYYEQLIPFSDYIFYRSNKIVIVVDSMNKDYFNHNLYCVKDSLKKISGALNTYDSIVHHSANWAFYQVRLKNDTLLGSINFQTPIPFCFMDPESGRIENTRDEP